MNSVASASGSSSFCSFGNLSIISVSNYTSLWLLIGQLADSTYALLMDKCRSYFNVYTHSIFSYATFVESKTQCRLIPNASVCSFVAFMRGDSDYPVNSHLTALNSRSVVRAITATTLCDVAD